MPALLRREFNGLLRVSLVTIQKEEREVSNKPFCFLHTKLYYIIFFLSIK